MNIIENNFFKTWVNVFQEILKIFSKFFLFIFSSIFLFLPSILYFYYDISLSISLSLSLFLFILCLLKYKNIYIDSIVNIKNLNILYVTMLLLILHSLISIVVFNNSIAFKMFLSISYLSLLIFFSFLLMIFLINMQEIKLKDLMNRLFYFMIILGIISIFLNHYELILPKSVVIFKEPSHFALYFIPIVLFKCYYQIERYRVYTLISVFILAFLIKNFVLIASIICISLVSLKIRTIFLLSISLIIFLSVSSIFTDMNDYILHRLDFSVLEANSKNMSAFVYLSGWERMYLGLINTSGFGIGINNFGIIEEGYYGKEIIKYLGFLLNYNDGSFLFSKFVGEFGLLGLGLSSIYFYFLIIFSYKYKNHKISNSYDLFFMSIYISFLVYSMFRGQGYFNTFTLLFYSSICFFLCKKNLLMKKFINEK